jgi:ribonuclease PH
MAPARPDGRSARQLRPVTITAGAVPYAEGSALCAFGQTRVLCAASVEAGVPRWLEGRGRGWVTAEYAMLPRATHTRTSRDHRTGGRAREISRLIGRSLRAAVELEALEGYTVKVDCDVLVADGGTRTAAVTGGWVALAQALAQTGLAAPRPVAAVSCGRVGGELLLDLCYQEDSAAEVDLNLVCGDGGRLVEVQATGEEGLFSAEELAELTAMGLAAGAELMALQAAALEE